LLAPTAANGKEKKIKKKRLKGNAMFACQEVLSVVAAS
jgi:hypothetical protein